MKTVNSVLGFLALLVSFVPGAALAEAEAQAGGADRGLVALAAGIVLGLAATSGTISQGLSVSAGLQAIGRNPEAQNKIFTPMILGLALIESLVILSFVIAYLLLGKV